MTPCARVRNSIGHVDHFLFSLFRLHPSSERPDAIERPAHPSLPHERLVLSQAHVLNVQLAHKIGSDGSVRRDVELPDDS